MDMFCRLVRYIVRQALLLARGHAARFTLKTYLGCTGLLFIQALLQALFLGKQVQGSTSKNLEHCTDYKCALNGWGNFLGAVVVFEVVTRYCFLMTIPESFQLLLLSAPGSTSSSQPTITGN